MRFMREHVNCKHNHVNVLLKSMYSVSLTNSISTCVLLSATVRLDTGVHLDTDT